MTKVLLLFATLFIAWAGWNLRPEKAPAQPEIPLAPDFELTSLDGKTIQLSDYRGKVVVVNMWATWCKPCASEMPAMQRVYEKYHADGLEILALNQAEPIALIQPFVEDYQLTFPVLLDSNETVARSYKTVAYPTTYFIGKEGHIVEVVFGQTMTETEFEQKILALLLA